MGKLYIVRHGETVWNREGRIQGHTDVALSERGLEQARLLAKRLNAVPFDAAYASDLSRAYETAATVLEGRNVPIYPTPRLREYHKGGFEGMTEAEIRSLYPNEYPGYVSKDLDYAPEGGESTREVSGRMAAVINEIKESHLGDNVLVVGHGGSLRAAMMSLLGMSLDANWRFVFGNCTLSIVDTYQDNAVLRLFNDGSHLAGIEFPFANGAVASRSTVAGE
jgi:broad specificity phosphatase PhoE